MSEEEADRDERNIVPQDSRTAELQPGDAYMEGPYLVFTEQYHLRRGYCCNSSCRHCPYREGAS